MRQTNSLRFRVAFVFAVFGALLSILFSALIYLATHQLGNRLIDETLSAELDDTVARHARTPTFIPPNTTSIKGYVLAEEMHTKNVPPEIITLLPGRFNVSIGEIDYRALVADRNGFRYFMLFDTKKQHARETKFIRLLVYFALFMTLASAGGGFWMAVAIVTPVTRLARQVSQAEPGDTHLTPDKLARNDEVGELARAFDRYLRRMDEFIKREHYFTSDVSHELRTPLAIIMGAVEVLEQDEMLSTKQKERIQRIRRAAQDMREQSTALLLLARERVPASGEPLCNVGEIVRSCVDKHQHLIGDRSIRLEVELSGEPHLTVERHLLEIVIGNLLRNALFNTQSGTILLRLEAERLIVKDTGFGIPPEMLAHVFEHHYKGTTSTGAGVGLSLVKRVCDRYGWLISIDSQAGLGTTVAIDFTPEKSA